MKSSSFCSNELHPFFYLFESSEQVGGRVGSFFLTVGERPTVFHILYISVGKNARISTKHEHLYRSLRSRPNTFCRCSLAFSLFADAAFLLTWPLSTANSFTRKVCKQNVHLFEMSIIHSYAMLSSKIVAQIYIKTDFIAKQI